MIRLNLNPQPEWLELLPGVRVFAAPATSAVMAAARHDPGVEAITADTRLEAAALAFARAVAKQTILDWEGVESEDGAPAPVGPETIDALFDHFRAFEAWQLRYMARWLGLEQEKNGSAPSPSGTSAGAPSTARPARRAAKPARNGNTSR